jgi:SAM-dependent methyltransferase
MNRNSDSRQAPTIASSTDPVVKNSKGAQAGSDTIVEHDPTLKWIISDYADASLITPPPITPVPIERTSPTPVTHVSRELTPPPLRVAHPIPPPASGRSVAASQSSSPFGKGTGVQRTLPSETRFEEMSPPVPEKVTNPPSITEQYLGATPEDFFTADSTPLPTTSSLASEGEGAAPTSMLPGQAGSDSELSADAVELLPSTAEETGPSLEPTTLVPTSIEDTPREGNSDFLAASTSESTAANEARDVDPEVLEMTESTEHQNAVEISPDRNDVVSTPPPVRPEILASTPRPRPPEHTSLNGEEPRSSTIAAALFEEYQTPAVSEDQIPEALARRSLKKCSKPWYEEVFDEDYLRTLPFMTPEQTAREVKFIRDVLSPPVGGEVLDVGCGYGRHTLGLAQQGLRLTGLDLSLPLLIRAADDAQRRGLAVNFVHADMREMTFNAQFDAAYCVLSSFGYFDEETNLRVASSIYRALKPGGRFLLDIINRDYIVGDLPSRVWWEGDGCVVLEEVDFNYHTSRVLVRRSVVFGNGRQIEHELSMRAYSLHEVGRLLRQAGLRVLEVSGGMATKSRFFGAASRNIIALCERPAL